MLPMVTVSLNNGCHYVLLSGPLQSGLAGTSFLPFSPPLQTASKSSTSQESHNLPQTRICSTMFNNSSDPWMLTDQTSAPEFADLLSCYRWYMQNNTASIAQADEACSMHEDLVGLGTGEGIVSLLAGLITIISNAAVILGIVSTRELRTPVYFFLANLAMADVFAGIGLLYRTVGYTGHNLMYDFNLNYFNFVVFSQMTSASALSLLSVNSYVAFWLLPLLLMAVCMSHPDACARRIGPVIFSSFSLNSLINPMATLYRTAELRNAIWEKLTGIHQTLVTVIRRNHWLQMNSLQWETKFRTKLEQEVPQTYRKVLHVETNKPHQVWLQMNSLRWETRTKQEQEMPQTYRKVLKMETDKTHQVWLQMNSLWWETKFRTKLEQEMPQIYRKILHVETNKPHQVWLQMNSLQWKTRTKLEQEMPQTYRKVL
uniref:G-protein coupled receptors family 1 profile domain-containing protein n=1 Tax=Branchiostoma floridae TaxID=7739 RepID=C3ZL18_BRAFL|eukprot:XP_002590689.1 hypothetical protein BRAFLDRAFT_89491 [Branchiostoma floridae]